MPMLAPRRARALGLGGFDDVPTPVAFSLQVRRIIRGLILHPDLRDFGVCPAAREDDH